MFCIVYIVAYSNIYLANTQVTIMANFFKINFWGAVITLNVDMDVAYGCKVDMGFQGESPF